MATRTAVGLGVLLCLVLAGCEQGGSHATATAAANAHPAAKAATLAVAKAMPANVDAERLDAAASNPSQWMTYGGTYSEQRYSKLAQINTSNVRNLGLAWYANYDTNLQQEGQPLEIDGVIYVSTAWSKVYAFDARTGKTLWEYDPKTPGQWVVNVCCGIVNRGIAAWKGKIYIGTLDGKLVALDARTGKPVWSVQTTDRSKHYSITGAPRVAKGMVLIGESGGEFGVRGYLSAYDAETGKLDWRFYTVPGNPKDGFKSAAMRAAAKTWGGHWWTLGGGGTVWDAILYDPKTDLIYFGSGNGSPWNDHYRDPTGGDDLYLASIIALKPETGRLVWYYQETPADTWDYDAVSPMEIVDLKIHGKLRHVIMQPSKNGIFYMLDAATGKLLAARPFTEVNWTTGVDMRTGRPHVIPAARYSNGHSFDGLPGAQGGHNWNGNAWDPHTGLLYIPTQHAYYIWQADPHYKPSKVGYNLGVNFMAQFTYYRKHPHAPHGFVSYLEAYDPITGKILWHGPSDKGETGGALATAGGLVFEGGGSSDEFRAFDARTGKILWSINAVTGVLPAPITYELDGKQYVAASVGGNPAGGFYAPNYSRMLVFTLGAKGKLPPQIPYTPRKLDPPPATAPLKVVQSGATRYGQYCAACHGQNGQTRGASFPNLTRSPLLDSQQAFDAVVLKGGLASKGMASFASVLDDAGARDIRAYIISRANALLKAAGAGGHAQIEGLHASAGHN